MGRSEWATLVRGWFPELVDAGARSLTFSAIEVHRGLIKAMLETNTVTTVHQRLRDEHGLGVGISSFRRYVAAEFPDESLRERVSGAYRTARVQLPGTRPTRPAEKGS